MVGVWAAFIWLAANFPNFQEMLHNYLIVQQYRMDSTYRCVTVYIMLYSILYGIVIGGQICCGSVLPTQGIRFTNEWNMCCVCQIRTGLHTSTFTNFSINSIFSVKHVAATEWDSL